MAKKTIERMISQKNTNISIVNLKFLSKKAKYHLIATVDHMRTKKVLNKLLLSLVKFLNRRKIRNYIRSLNLGEELRVIFGGHWSNNPGWLTLSEADQDITKPLCFESNSVDAVFVEHVIEHIDFVDAIFFMKEAKRILKKGGVFRIVSPMLEKLISAELSQPHGEIYLKKAIIPFIRKEHEILKKLTLKGIFDAPKVFLFHNTYRCYDHKFIWSADLMVKVLKVLKFSSVQIQDIGLGINPEYCIERRYRGIYLGNDWKKDRSFKSVFNAESMVVEAIK